MFYNIFRFFFTVICFIAIFYLLEDINFLILKNRILNVHPFNFIVIIFINLATLALLFIRFSFLIKQLDLPFGRRLFVVFNSNLFNIIPIPGFAEAFKYADINNLAGKENSLYIVTLEKFTSLCIYLLLLIIIFAFLNLGLSIFILFLLILLIAIIHIQKKKYNLPYLGYVFQKLATFYKNFNFIFFITFLYSLIMHLLSFSIPLYIFYMLEIIDGSNILTGLFIITIGNFISSLPISFLGFGVRDLTYLFLGNYFLSISPDLSFVVSSLLNLLVLFNHFICFGISCFFFWKKNYSSRLKI